MKNDSISKVFAFFLNIFVDKFTQSPTRGLIFGSSGGFDKGFFYFYSLVLKHSFYWFPNTSTLHYRIF